MRSLKDLLPRTFHPAVLSQMHATAVVEAAQRVVNELMPEVASMIVVKYIKDRVLYVGTTSSALVTEIKLREHTIVKRIEALVRQNGVVERIYAKID